MSIAIAIGIKTGKSKGVTWTAPTISALSVLTTSDTTQTITATIVGTDYDGVSYEYSTDGVSYTEKGTSATETYNATGLTSGTLYYWRARVYKGTNYGDYSSVDSESTLTGLTRNADIVVAGGYLAIGTAANLGFANTGRSFLSTNNSIKCRQDGSITKVVFYTNSVQYVTSFYFQVWRKDGATYDLVAEENIADRIAHDTTNDVTLNTPMAVQEGDYFALAVTVSQDDFVESSLAAIATGTSNSFRYYTSGTRPTGNDFDWDGKSTLTNLTVPIIVYMQAPMVALIGDSIIAGHNSHYSYVEDSLTDARTNSVAYQLAQLNNKYIYQNMGIGSQTSTDVKNRFTADVVNLKPKMVIILIGVNDIAGGVITKATFLSNYTTMLDACVTGGIKAIVCKITPWTNGTNGQMQTRDDWMTDLKTLVETYSGFLFVDFDSAIGKFRAGGDAGNKWDIQTTPDYDDDGVHLTLAGYTKMADVLNTSISTTYYLH